MMKTFLEYIKRGTKQVEKGIKKYGGTLDEKELSAIELIDHAVEEHVDAIFYMLKLREELDNKTCFKVCDTCKHIDIYPFKAPCKSCKSQSKWQPLKEGTE